MYEYMYTHIITTLYVIYHVAAYCNKAHGVVVAARHGQEARRVGVFGYYYCCYYYVYMHICVYVYSYSHSYLWYHYTLLLLLVVVSSIRPSVVVVVVVVALSGPEVII